MFRSEMGLTGGDWKLELPVSGFSSGGGVASWCFYGPHSFGGDGLYREVDGEWKSNVRLEDAGKTP